MQRRICLKSSDGSADSADDHVEVGSSLSREGVAIAFGHGILRFSPVVLLVLVM